MARASSVDRLERLRGRLEDLCLRTDFRGRIENDPVAVPRRFTDPLDIEIAAWLASALAYGRVPLFRRALDRIFDAMGGRPHAYVSAFKPERDLDALRPLYYRLNTGEDIACLIYLIGRVIERHGSVGAAFASHYREEDEDVGPALDRFVAGVLDIDATPIYGRRGTPRGLSQLLSRPSKGSACKRLNLFLRWMVRPDDGLDFGLWKAIPPSKLVIPLDTHVLRISRYLGLTRRRSAGWTTAAEITAALRRIDPKDPLRFDFPICHLGISGACPIGKEPAKCERCALRSVCLKGGKLLAARR
ncbi:MAG: TIGR02757 family protein [Elusimicrobia bacterium]|nr:TIGR02757 family protein [Elusimicrobiota bacterium]